jgi:MoaA/NifB/PqqE/SkfB family radical SAM enzyme
MIQYNDIRDVHLEISSLCNASCPWCPRTFWGYPYNGGYPETYLTLQQCKKIFDENFLNQLTSIRVNGNFGDIVMNPEGADIIEYFSSTNPELNISINTNGGARDSKFWTRLALAGAQVRFALDGLADTHHLYRQNTVWSTVIRNANTFIAAGGHAAWQMIAFKHNQHQIQDCRNMSRELGFQEFDIVDDGRNTAPVFDRHGQLVHVMGDYQGETRFEVLFYRKKTDDVMLEDLMIDRAPKKHINCETKMNRSIYIAANGDVSPCCFTGFYPATYGRGQYHQAANAQLIPLIAKNNALTYDIKECIQWFAEVEKSWSRHDYNQGRLIICDDNCGSDL